MSTQKILKTLEENLEAIQKAKKTCKQPNEEKITYKPFFSSLLIKERKEYDIHTLNGSTILFKKPHLNEGFLGRIEIRMGHPEKGGSAEWGSFAIPKDLKKELSKRQILESANEIFWGCAKDLEKRYTKTIGKKDKKEKYIYFSKEKPSKFIQKKLEVEVDLNLMEKTLKKVSKNLQLPWIKDIEAVFSVLNNEMYYVNSDGSKIFTNSIQYSIGLIFYALDKKNLIIPHKFIWNGNELSRFPTYKELMDNGKKIIGELEEILKSPVQENGVFPTILDAENVGLLFHEVIGHGLEGHRMLEDDSEESINLFKNKINCQVAPDFLDLYDDPTLKYFKGIPLSGHYLYDEDGVKGKKVILLKNGVLKNYLHSRESAGYFNVESSGHCRSEEINDPCVRMSNSIIKSHNETSFEKLKELLLEECEKQNKPYGLFLQKAKSGFVDLEENFYNAIPSNVFRIYKNGKVERIRGIYIVGTPYTAMNDIIKTSDNYQCFNGYCESESGIVSVSEIAPDALLKSLEISKIPEKSYEKVSEPVFNLPYIKPKS